MMVNHRAIPKDLRVSASENLSLDAIHKFTSFLEQQLLESLESLECL
jgi:hypothetical protein